MAGTGELVPYEGAKPLTQIERLTAQFYAWELRGRGWQLWPHPVALEPPFQPFYFHMVPAPAAVPDDGRMPTLLSTVAERVRNWFRPRPPSQTIPAASEPMFWETEPEPVIDASPLRTFQVSIPPTLKIGREVSEQFLLSLSACTRPVSFEVIGLADFIAVQFASRAGGQLHLRQQLTAHFPDAVVAEEPDLLAARWETDGLRETVVVDFGLSEEFMWPLRTVSTSTRTRSRP